MPAVCCFLFGEVCRFRDVRHSHVGLATATFCMSSFCSQFCAEAWWVIYRAQLSLTLHLPRRRQLPRSRLPRRSRRSPQRSEMALYHSFCFLLLCNCTEQLRACGETGCNIFGPLSFCLLACACSMSIVPACCDFGILSM